MASLTELAEAMDSFQCFCERHVSSEQKTKTANAVGSMLEAFFAQLHSWGRVNHGRASQLDGANHRMVKLMTEVHLSCIMESFKEAGYDLNQERQERLVAVMAKLEQSAYEQRDTVILADIRYVISILQSFASFL